MTFYVFLHGFPDLPSVWDPLLQVLSLETATVLRPNLWEIGIENGKPLSSDQIAAKLLLQLKKMKFTAGDEVFILGHDLGAAYAVALAQLIADQSTLILFNGMTPQMLLARMKSAGQALKSWYIWLMQIPLLPRAILRLDQKLPKRIAKFSHRPTEPAMCATADLYTGIQLYRSLFREGFFSTSEQKVKKLILIWGIQDPFLNSPTEAEFSHLANQVEIHLLNTHHWPQLQESQQVAKIIHADT